MNFNFYTIVAAIHHKGYFNRTPSDCIYLYIADELSSVVATVGKLTLPPFESINYDTLHLGGTITNKDGTFIWYYDITAVQQLYEFLTSHYCIADSEHPILTKILGAVCKPK